jgi:hypothetical protein
MKATGATLRRVSIWRVGFLSLEILVPNIILILDNPDVSRGRSWGFLSFGFLGQLFELTFLPSSLEGAAPRRWNIALRHKPSLGADVVAILAFAFGRHAR